MAEFRIDIVADPSRANRAADQVGRRLGRLENSADSARVKIGRMLALFGGGALVFNAVRTLATFEQAIANVGAISEASASQLEQLRATAQELGATTRFTATDAAEGLTFLARAGFTANEAIETIDDTLRLAQVGMLDLGSAADIATNVLAGFNLGVDQAGRFVDVLAKTANSSNTNVRQLGDAMKFVAPVAAGVGVTLEEAAAAIGTLSNAGLQASLAGTGLRKVLSELESPSETTRKVLSRLGLTTEDVRVSSVGLNTALDRLKDSGITAGQALEIFGQRGGPAAIVLTNATKATQELNKELENAQGFAVETAKRMDDNLLGSLLRVKSAFEAVILSLGKAGGTGALRGILESLADGLRTLAANADVLVNVAKNLALVLGPRFLLGAVRALSVALALNPIGFLITAASIAIALIPDLQSKLDSLVDTVLELGDKLLSSFNFEETLGTVAKFIDDTVGFFNGLGAAAGAVFDALSQQPEVAGELIRKGFRDAIEAVLDFFLAFEQTVGNIIIGIGDDAIQLLQNVGGAAGAISTGNLEAAQTFADNISSALTRSANRVTTFTGQFESNLKKLRDMDLLPEVVLSRDARELGDVVANEFKRGIDESGTVAQDTLASLIGGSPEEIATLAFGAGAAIGKEMRLGITAGRGAAAAPEEITPQLSVGAQDLLSQIDLTTQLAEQEGFLNEILATRPDLAREVGQALDDLRLKGLEASTDLGDGFERAFLKIRLEAEDLAAVGESIFNSFADNATDALVNFVETGKFEFKEFANSLLSDITRILARLLIVQALSAAFGGGGGAGGVAGAAGAFLPGRQHGGPVAAGRSYIVGEKKPEVFTPSQNGSVGQSAPAQAPQVNLQLVNVSDPKMVPAAIEAGESDMAVVNLIRRNAQKINRVLGS